MSETIFLYICKYQCCITIFCCLWSGWQTVYDEWFITLYNMVYTALPVLGMSLFDQVCTEGKSVISEV